MAAISKTYFFQTCFSGVTCSGDSDHKLENQENGTNNRVDAISKLTTVKGNNQRERERERERERAQHDMQNKIVESLT